MKRLLPLILLIAFATSTHAQVGFTLGTVPCNNNGILSASFTSALTPPLTVTWTTMGTTGTTITHTGVSGLGDALTGYSGGPVNVMATDIYGVNEAGLYSGMAPFAVAVTATSAVCPAPGSVAAAVAGGTAPYSYQWIDVTTSAVVGTGSAITLPHGVYGVKVTDAAGCVYGSNVDNINDTIFSIPTFSVTTSTTMAACTNGTATAAAVGGGTAPFTYAWSNGARLATISGLVTGYYSVMVTDGVGCTNSALGVYVPQAVTISVPVTATPATCSNADGVITSAASGGAAPYTYVWSNGGSTATQTGVPGGFYWVDVTDAGGCMGSGSVYVGTASSLGYSYSVTPSLCTTPTGTATLIIGGGTAPYAITWYTHPAATGTSATGLAAGSYSFDITDAAGCEQSGTVAVPPVDIITATFSATNAVCLAANGSLTVNPVGGVAPYTYSWSNGATTQSITGVTTGPYSVTVRDNLGCKVKYSHDVPVSSPVGIGLSAVPASCIFTNDGSIIAVPFGGTAPYVYSWTGGGTASSLGSLPSGYYTVRVMDAAGCTASNGTYLGYSTSSSACYCTISGTAYNDTNGNCLQDAGEQGLPNVQIGFGSAGYTYTDIHGNYSMLVPAATYTITETTTPCYALPACQASNIVLTAGAGAGCLHTVNFANIVTAVHDMHISTWDYTRAVPGNKYTQKVIITNDGTMTEDSVITDYGTDGQAFTPAFLPSGMFAGIANLYNTSGVTGLDSLMPGESKTYLATFNVPANIALGSNLSFRDTIAYLAPVSNWMADNTPWNNVSGLNSTVVATTEPNFKQVYPQGSGPAGLIAYTDSVLEYMVHFQNTGNTPVQNLIVVDTLDDNLNWSTLMPVYQSAPCQVTVAQNGPRKIARFTFSNINLPAKINNEMSSNGMLTYTVRIKSGLPVGTQFRNRASIYFDYNAPVMTNTTLNTLGSAASAVSSTFATANRSSFLVYPNPAGNNFNAIINSINNVNADLKVCDITGKTLISKTIGLQKGSQTIATDISALTAGVYFVMLVENGTSYTQKLVIIR